MYSTVLLVYRASLPCALKYNVELKNFFYCIIVVCADLKIADLYTDAAKHYPKNQEILTHLFMAYVRVGDTAKQQQVAGKLCKTFPTNGPYQCWRVMSVMTQVSGE